MSTKNSSEPEPRLVSPAEASRTAAVRPFVLLRWFHRGAVRLVRIQGRPRVNLDDLTGLALRTAGGR